MGDPYVEHVGLFHGKAGSLSFLIRQLAIFYESTALVVAMMFIFRMTLGESSKQYCALVSHVSKRNQLFAVQRA